MSKSTRKSLEQACASMGCDIDWDDSSRSLSVHIDAPRGKIFAATLTHGLVCSAYHGKGTTAYVVSTLMEDLSMGLEDCEESGCEVCEETEEDAPRMRTLSPLERIRRADLIREGYSVTCDSRSEPCPETGYIAECHPDIEVTVSPCGCHQISIHHQCQHGTEYEYGWCMVHHEVSAQTYEEAIADVRINESNKRLAVLEAIERR